MSTEHYRFSAIGHIHSPYPEKFGIPRQAGLAPSVQSQVLLAPDYNHADIVRGLEAASHLWLVFVFDQTLKAGWQPTVRPPRLGGQKRLGVFATRSPHRPNPIGLSAVRLHRIEHTDTVVLHISDADLVNGTPILDIKPYLPYADQLPDAQFTIAPDAPAPHSLPLMFSASAAQALAHFSQSLGQPLAQQLSEVLQADPRPAHLQQASERVFGLSLYQLNIRFQILAEHIAVLSIEQRH